MLSKKLATVDKTRCVAYLTMVFFEIPLHREDILSK